MNDSSKFEERTFLFQSSASPFKNSIQNWKDARKYHPPTDPHKPPTIFFPKYLFLLSLPGVLQKASTAIPGGQPLPFGILREWEWAFS